MSRNDAGKNTGKSEIARPSREAPKCVSLGKYCVESLFAKHNKNTETTPKMTSKMVPLGTENAHNTQKVDPKYNLLGPL